MRFVPLLLCVGCAARAPLPFDPPAHVDAVRDRVDWDMAGVEAARTLSEYLKIETLPGRERPGAEFLGAVLDHEGIPYEIVEYEPGYVNLIARLDSGTEASPLCLLSHIDVVPADAPNWPDGNGPFSGTIDDDGVVWGRGALDMKSLGVLELLTMAWLARLDVPLARDVVLLAVSAEETDNRGAKWLAAHWDRIGCSHVLNEGGIGIDDALFPGQAVYFVSTGEKGTAWVDLVASGEPGHGSTPMPDQSTDRLIRALDRHRHHVSRPRIPEPLYDLLDAVGRQKGGVTGAVLRSRFLVNTLARGRLLSEPAVRAVTTDTCNVTGFVGGDAHNTVASRSVAHLDCRLRPETAPDAFIEALRRTYRHDGVEIEVVSAGAGAYSPTDDPLYRAIVAYVTEGEPDAVAGPVLSVGYTDSLLLRPLGVRAYGIAPFRVTADQARTMHGDGEHVSTEDLRRGLYALTGLVVDQAARAD